MNYSVNPNELTSIFALPSSIAEDHIKLASEYQLKAILIFIKNQNDNKVIDIISKRLSLSESEVVECLDYWVQRGVLTSENSVIKEQKLSKVTSVTVSTEKPTREEAVNRISNSKELQYLTDVVQQKLSRPITTAEMKTLVWLVDCYGLPVPVIIMAVQYAIDSERLNFSYIEKVCIDWAKNDITTLQQAEERLNALYLSKTAWNIVRSAFGIELRKPSKQEKAYSDKWVNEYGFQKNMLTAAYDICINKTAKINFKYIGTVLDNWHKLGFKSPADLEKADSKSGAKDDTPSYSISKIKKKINNFD